MASLIDADDSIAAIDNHKATVPETHSLQSKYSKSSFMHHVQEPIAIGCDATEAE